MKIRIKGNSLRFRLSQSELAQFADSGIVQDKISFGDVELRYVLQRQMKDELSASFSNNCITMIVPELIAREWTETDRVGFENKMITGNSGQTLSLLLEKDFTCLDRTQEDQSDNFPNPLLKHTV